MIKTSNSLQPVLSHTKATRMFGSSASLPPITTTVGGGKVNVEFAPGHIELPSRLVIGWVLAAARAVTAYYGRFPVREANVLIIPVEHRGGILSGTSWGSRPVSTRIYLGELVDSAQLKADWIMTHEMVHYAFPSMPEEHHWIEEGIATYVEPLARLETGEIGREKVWSDLIEELQFGLPAPGDQGLDHTHTWGRTYWGGAMFCLLADVMIRRQTKDRYGLRDALRAIINAGGNIEASWPLTRALEIGDHAVGVTVLMDLYEEMKATPLKPQLPQLWRKLGIETDRRPITFDDTAPWASTRRAITVDQSDR
ncbi:MAG: hypothetical protein JO189_27955 [Deltaproteobacteria bacterium]|nr:hypothetical protein [Deltaproteobacteria bacterium]